MYRCILTLVVASTVASIGGAAELAKIDRAIKKEPTYTGKPKYALLVFGPEAKERVWLVQDGGTLYVDRNGNGDLTEAGEKIAAKTDVDVQEEGYAFEVGEVTVGGKTHKNLLVGSCQLRSPDEAGSFVYGR